MKRDARASTRGPVPGFLPQAAHLVRGLLPKTLACSAGFLCGEIVQSLIARCFELCDLRRRFPGHTQNLLAKLCRAARTRSEVYGGVRIGDGGHRPPCVAAASVRACRPSRNPPSEDPSLQQMPRRNHGLRASFLARARVGVYGGVRIGNGGHRPPCAAAASMRACRPSRNPPSEDPLPPSEAEPQPRTSRESSRAHALGVYGGARFGGVGDAEAGECVGNVNGKFRERTADDRRQLFDMCQQIHRRLRGRLLLTHCVRRHPQRSWRPSSERLRVISSAYSRWPPTGSPCARRVRRIP